MKSTIVKILTAALAVSMMACVAVGCNGSKTEGEQSSTASSQVSKTESKEESKTESTEDSKTESKEESKTESVEASKEESPAESTPDASVEPGEAVDVVNVTAEQIGDTIGGVNTENTYEFLMAELTDGKAVICVSPVDGEGASLFYGSIEKTAPVDNGDGTTTFTQTVKDEQGNQTVMSITVSVDDPSTFIVALQGMESPFTTKAVEDKEKTALSIRTIIANATQQTEESADEPGEDFDDDPGEEPEDSEDDFDEELDQVFGELEEQLAQQ